MGGSGGYRSAGCGGGRGVGGTKALVIGLLCGSGRAATPRLRPGYGPHRSTPPMEKNLPDRRFDRAACIERRGTVRRAGRSGAGQENGAAESATREAHRTPLSAELPEGERCAIREGRQQRKDSDTSGSLTKRRNCIGSHGTVVGRVSAASVP